MKLIHTSDWHLGARLHDQDRGEEHDAFLAFLLNLVREERPDALLIAGDVFDVRQPGPAAQQRYYRFIADLVKDGACGRLIVVAGNHDSASLLAAPRELLAHLDVLVVAKASDEPSGEVIPLPGCVVAALPFMNDGELATFARAAGLAEGEGMAARTAAGWQVHVGAVLKAAREAARGAPVVAMAHCALAGAAVSDDRSERGRRVGGLETFPTDCFAGVDYVALGHLHLPQTVGGDPRLRYAGAPLAMSFDEAARPKSVAVVEVGERAGDPVAVREVPVPRRVALRRLTGTQEAILAETKALVASGEPVYMAARVTEGEGDLTAFWRTLEASVPADGAARLLVREDGRPRLNEGGGLATVSEAQPLDAFTPLAVAELRLKEDPTLSEADRNRYLDLLRQAIGGME